MPQCGGGDNPQAKFVAQRAPNRTRQRRDCPPVQANEANLRDSSAARYNPGMPSFKTTLHQTGNNVGIIVPDDVVAELGAGKRPLVTVTIDGRYTFDYTLGVMGGRTMIGFSAAHRAASGLSGGDEVQVTLRLQTTPREVDVPPELAAALAADPLAAAAFEKLAFTHRKEHARAVSEAKAPETKQRRVERAIALLHGAPPA